MTTNTLDFSSARTLRGLLGARAKQLVWDLNTVYIVYDSEIAEIKQTPRILASPYTNEHEDIYPIVVNKVSGSSPFNEKGEPGKLYRVVATDERITNIEIVRIAIRFGKELHQWETVAPSKVDTQAADIALIDCGVLVHTPVGVLAAIPDWCALGFRCESFGSGPAVSLVSSADAEAMVQEEYEIVSIPDAP